jgi:hypothetical protein
VDNKNITRLQKIKWRLNSRWTPKIVFGLESTNLHFFKKLFFLDFFSVLRSFYGKTFFLIQNGGLYRDGVFVILKSPYFQKILCKQLKIQQQKFEWIYKVYILKKNNQLVVKRKISI